MTACNTCGSTGDTECVLTCDNAAQVERMRTIRIVELATHRIASEIHTSDEAYRDGIMRTARLAIENGTEPNDIIW